MKIKRTSILKLSTSIPVYDIEVANTHNFKIKNATFVHNSKDLADAVGQVVYNCHINPHFQDDALLGGSMVYSEGDAPEITKDSIIEEFEKWNRQT